MKLRSDADLEKKSMRSISRMLVVLAVAMGLAAAGLALSSHENPALAAKAKPSKGKAGKASGGSAGKTGFEHQQCTWENPCPIYNF